MVLMHPMVWLLLVGLLAPVNLLAQSGNNARKPRKPAPRNAVQAILGAFDRYPLVALGEFHRNQQEHDFILSLLRSPDFPSKANDIVVEFGTARYQDLTDRYIEGGPVTLDQLKPVWRDTVNILVWDAPVYQRFFEAIREINLHLPEARRMRVLLGDPPFHWDRVQTREQWEQIVAQRDTHAVDVIEEQVLAKGRRALLLYGMGHVERFPPEPGKPANLIALLEGIHRRASLVIWPYTSGWGNISRLDARLEPWPNPSFAELKGTWLGSLVSEKGLNMPPLEALADALLYFGRIASQTQSRPPDSQYLDPAFFRELLRRDQIQGGFNRDELQRLKGLLFRGD